MIIAPRYIFVTSLHFIIQVTQLNHFPFEVRKCRACRVVRSLQASRFPHMVPRRHDNGKKIWTPWNVLGYTRKSHKISEILTAMWFIFPHLKMQFPSEFALARLSVIITDYVYGKRQTVDVSQNREILRFSTCFTLLRSYSIYLTAKKGRQVSQCLGKKEILSYR